MRRRAKRPVPSIARAPGVRMSDWLGRLSAILESEIFYFGVLIHCDKSAFLVATNTLHELKCWDPENLCVPGEGIELELNYPNLSSSFGSEVLHRAALPPIPKRPNVNGQHESRHDTTYQKWAT